VKDALLPANLVSPNVYATKPLEYRKSLGSAASQLGSEWQQRGSTFYPAFNLAAYTFIPRSVVAARKAVNALIN
jgi:hypothetical protein